MNIRYDEDPRDEPTIDETPESVDVGQGLDNDENVHSDDWDNDQEEEN